MTDEVPPVVEKAVEKPVETPPVVDSKLLEQIKQNIEKKKQPKQENILQNFLLLAICGISALMVVLYFKQNPQILKRTAVPEIKTVVPTIPSTTLADIETLQKNSRRMADQIWLLGIQANQNASLFKQSNEGYANRVLILTEDWRLDQKPDSLKMSDENLRKLQTFINEKSSHTEAEYPAAMPLPIND